ATRPTVPFRSITTALATTIRPVVLKHFGSTPPVVVIPLRVLTHSAAIILATITLPPVLRRSLLITPAATTQPPVLMRFILTPATTTRPSAATRCRTTRPE